MTEVYISTSDYPGKVWTATYDSVPPVVNVEIDGVAYVESSRNGVNIEVVRGA